MTDRRHPMIPIAPPRMVEEFYTPDEVDILQNLLKQDGPWPLLLSHHFKTAEEYIAVAGGKNVSPDAKLTDFTSPSFREYLAIGGVVFYEQLHDLYFSKKLLDMAKSMHGAEYGLAHHMLFNLCGPSHSFDAGHFDTPNWRGIGSDAKDTPLWLQAVMAKSGLFDHWKVKTSQVITYFCTSDIDGGFTYWPDGPDRTPKRFAAPFWNSAIVTDNTQMYHRREANGPRDRRDCPGLDMHSLIEFDGQEWVITTDGTEIQRFPDELARSLFHYTALLFDDRKDVERYLNHTDDLTRDKVLDMLMDDMRSKGVSFDDPADPLTDPTFIATCSATYAMSPDEYPEEAPLAS